MEGDYVSVMPLVWNTRLFGVQQLYQPFFCQQLGVYSEFPVTEERIKAFLGSIPRRFRFVEVQLNERTPFPSLKGVAGKEQFNCVLPLEKSYESLRRNYSESLRRSLKKAAKHGFTLTRSISPQVLLEQYRTYQGPKIGSLDNQLVEMAISIVEEALKRNRGFVLGLNDSEGKLVASAFFLESHGRIISLIPAVTAEGRRLNAMHHLLDSVIRENAGTDKVLDFDGSTIPSIARFFKSFGSQEMPFYRIQLNRLPFWIRWYKSDFVIACKERYARRANPLPS